LRQKVQWRQNCGHLHPCHEYADVIRKNQEISNEGPLIFPLSEQSVIAKVLIIHLSQADPA
jgi:hypothetical protein